MEPIGQVMQDDLDQNTSLWLVENFCYDNINNENNNIIVVIFPCQSDQLTRCRPDIEQEVDFKMTKMWILFFFM